MRRSKNVFGNHYVNFKRNIHKSIRLDSRIFRYIMQAEGPDFADKLENLIIDHSRLTNRLSDLLN